MTPTVVLPVIIGGLYAAGVYLLLDRSLTRVLLGFLLLGNATNLLLLSSGGPAGLAPILGVSEPEEMSDPLPQALILTAIVITFGVAAFMLAIIYRSWRLVRQEVVGVDEEDRRVARRAGTDADEMDPDDLAPEDRAAGHADSLHSDRQVEELLDRHYADIPSDDVDLPPDAAAAPVIRVLTPLPVLLPLLGAAAALLVGGRHPRTQRALSIAVLTAVLIVSVLLLLHAHAEGADAVSVGGWPVPLGIVLVVDRLSALMLVVAATVALGVLVFAVGQGSADGDEETPISIFHPTFLVLMAGVANAFLAGDLFNLYVGFEILLTASYVLLTLGGSAPRIRAGVTYIVVSLLSSLLFLAAIALIYASTGTVNMAQLAVRLGDLPDGVQQLLHALLLIAFSIKAAVFPLSAWLPDSYPTAPAPVTAVFAGLLTKVGVYAIIRTQTLLFPGGALDQVLMWAALATMLVGILGAVAQTDIRRILSFTLVSHIGYMVFGIALSTTAGLAGAIFYVVHHIAIQTTLFLVAGLIERRGDSTAVDRLGGLAKASPLLAILFFVPAMNLAGIPPLSGFIGKLGLLEAGVAVGGWLPYVLVAAGVVTSLLTLVAVSRVWSRAFWRPPAQSPDEDTFQAAADDAGPESGAAPSGDGGREPPDDDREAARGGSATSTRTATRQAAWARHTAVATATTPATDGLGGDGASRPALRPLPQVMVGATAAMVAVTVALTVLAGPLYAVADQAATDLYDRVPYIAAVLGAEP